jgi:site-specific recombinase XerC
MGVYAVRRACHRARIETWHPNQLRHSAGTEIRKRYDLEAAQVVLGHSRADVTQVYAQRDQSLPQASPPVMLPRAKYGSGLPTCGYPRGALVPHGHLVGAT